QLSQLRAAIEPPAAALAALNADDGSRRRIVEVADALETTGAAGDLRTFLEHDVLFHRLLLESSGNSMFLGLAYVVEEVLRGRTDHDLMPPHPKPEARRLHAVVAEAVAGREPEVAQAAMTAICAEVVAAMGRLPTTT
ncbi:MAG TPA: FCD domain-containing protein, partial [Nocardioidaceae bacterium]|nr:FCD domain-containing protein [Nocardioidaceae bacterium]